MRSVKILFCCQTVFSHHLSKKNKKKNVLINMSKKCFEKTRFILKRIKVSNCKTIFLKRLAKLHRLGNRALSKWCFISREKQKYQNESNIFLVSNKTLQIWQQGIVKNLFFFQKKQKYQIESNIFLLSSKTVNLATLHCQKSQICPFFQKKNKNYQN